MKLNAATARIYAVPSKADVPGGDKDIGTSFDLSGIDASADALRDGLTAAGATLEAIMDDLRQRRQTVDAE